MTQTMIEANEIRMALGEGAGRVEALKGINLSLAGGELTLLMGPSGSGKTTLLSVLGCMLSPTSGSVNIRGRAVTGLDAEALAQVRRENIGFVFQSYHLFPTLTAAENVRLSLDVRGHRCISTGAVRRRAAARGSGARHRRQSVAPFGGRADSGAR
jgi:putative ABC transport system ATP-binding protein